MITKYIEFLKEYTSYTGPFSSTGFKTGEPKEEFTLDLNLKYDENNEKVIKDILSKYNIHYSDLNLEHKNDFLSRSNVQKFKLDFLTYSELEAQSIIVSILRGLEENKIYFEHESIKVNPEPNMFRNRKPIGFNR